MKSTVNIKQEGFQKAIVISASSDIGAAMCHRWRSQGLSVWGTYRTASPQVEQLQQKGVSLIPCDLGQRTSVAEACQTLRKACPDWDVLVIAPGTQDPVGSFLQCDFDEWEKSIEVNFTAQLRIFHELYPARNIHQPLQPCVMYFAGGGTNNATVNYSAYTISKIGLIKMCELLDAEIPDTRFVILGPGWVKTKIHEATLTAGQERAGENFAKTQSRLAGDACTPMADVLDCCDWLVVSPREEISGRNFSVVFDQWGSDVLRTKLRSEANMYKLRRYGNDLLVKPSTF